MSDTKKSDDGEWNFEVKLNEDASSKKGPQDQSSGAIKKKSFSSLKKRPQAFSPKKNEGTLEGLDGPEAELTLGESVRGNQDEMSEKRRKDTEALAGPQNAPVMRRLAAGLIDYGVCFLLLKIYPAAEALLRTHLFSSSAKVFYSNQLHLLGFFIWFCAILFVLFFLPIMLFKNTFGKLLLFLNYEDIDGGPPSRSDLLLRELVYRPFTFLTLFGLIPMAFDRKNRRGLHDRLSHTKVIKR